MLAGEALDEMQNHGAAIEQFRAAVKADPKFPNVHFGLGYLLWSQNQLEEAAQEFQAELNNVPQNAQALAYLADCDLRLNHSESVRPLAEKAIQIDPGLERANGETGSMHPRQFDDCRAMAGRVTEPMRPEFSSTTIILSDPASGFLSMN